jgi:hypothetical protein
MNNAQNPNTNLDQPIWSAEAIGEIAGLSERQAFYALEKGALAGTKVRNRWVSTRRRIYRSLGIEA